MYAELHCLTNFSFLRGASHAPELVERAQALGYRALAITDECSMAGVVRAHQAAERCGLPLIIGSEFQLADGPKLILLAQDHAGYTAICRLITRARRASTKGTYRIGRADFSAPLAGVSALYVPRGAGSVEELAWMRDACARDLAIAVELHRDADDAQRLHALTALGRRLDVPLAAAGDVHMHVRGRRALQDTLTAIRLRTPLDQCGAKLFANGERHLRSARALRELYPPPLLRATLAIAEACRFSLRNLQYEYPHELVPAGLTATAWLRQLTEDGLRRRFPGGTAPHVRELIEKELQLIAELKYEHFFLTVHDVVRFAREKNILCQGRGSAANSAVCYALHITEVDPARMNMLFERFLSKERNEPPDIDVDFEHQRREEVIQYIYGKYGRERAALAATVISYQPRSAVRDAGKALGFSLDQVDRLTRSMAWWDEGDALAARLREQGFDPDALPVRNLIRCVAQMLGFPRHLSQHVGGFVMSDQPLHELVPVENAAMADRTIIQWDKDDLEALGLLKVDCLALGMLSALRRALHFVERFEARPFALADIPAEDRATYDMICAGRTTGVFQIESRAQMSMLPRLKPREFYDLVIQVAIVRPGPIQGEMVHPYLRRRDGKEKVNYQSAALERVLKRTLGVPLFQEQVIQIAIVAAGFSAGEADQVRRSMAAWKRNGGLTHFHDRLIQGMAARGYTREFSESIYRMVLGFGSYGFPESHAASFALLAYASAWLKCHQPAAFFAALLDSQPMGFYPPSMLAAEARRAGVEVRPVDVTASYWDCTLERDAHGRAAIRLGLNRVKGLAEAAAQSLLAARAQKSFASVGDLVTRARLDARARKALADADALAALAGHRHRARWSALGVEDLPGMLRGNSAREPDAPLPAPRDGEEITYDYGSLGLSLRGHPLSLLRARLKAQRVLSAAELERVAPGRVVRVAGMVMFRQRPATASGVLFISLEDETGVVNLIVWPKVLEAQRRLVVGSSMLLCEGALQRESGVTHVIARAFEDRSEWLGAIPYLSRDFR